jgi:hypothetical protein
VNYEDYCTRLDREKDQDLWQVLLDQAAEDEEITLHQFLKLVEKTVSGEEVVP